MLHADERGQLRLWVAIVAVALLLLALILGVVISLSGPLRRSQTATVIQPAPVERVAGSAPSTEAPASPESAAPAPSTGAAPPASAEGESPLRVIRQPVKVVEKQVKVVEKQVKVVEKPVKVSEKRAAGDEERGAGRGAGTFQDTGLPNQLRYAGRRWNASEHVTGLPADLLSADPVPVDGRTVYRDAEAQPPYENLYLRVSGRTDQYVRYVPASW